MTEKFPGEKLTLTCIAGSKPNISLSTNTQSVEETHRAQSDTTSPYRAERERDRATESDYDL